jgi:hypothetical protein
MQFKWDTQWLTDTPISAASVRISGKQIAQESDLLRAVSATFFGRKNRSISIGFSVLKTFASVEACEEFMVTSYNTLLDSAVLTIRMGLTSDPTKDVAIPGSILSGIDFSDQVGVSVMVSYSFMCPKPGATVSTPPNDTFTSGTYAIPNGQNFVVVSGLGLSQVPAQVLVTVLKPAGGLTLIGTVVDGTVTTDGFTAYLNGQTDGPNYKVAWLATF